MEPGAAPIADLALRDEPCIVVGDGSVRLRGTRCPSCEQRSFPARHVCFGCNSGSLEDVQLGPGGTLYSYAIVHVAPARSTPYTIGYVDLDDGVRVLGYVRGQLRPDQRVHLAEDHEHAWAFVSDAAGTQR